MALSAVDTSLPGALQPLGTPLERGDRYGEAFIQDLREDRFAEEGSLFVCRSATLGTGIAQTANQTEDTTKPFLVGYNGATPGLAASKSIRLLRLKLRPTAVSSSQTIQNISVVTAGGNIYSSAGTDYNISVSGLNGTTGYANIGRASADNASVHSVLRVGVPVTVLGSSNPTLQARWSPRTTTIPVVGDEYIMYFGQRGPVGGGSSVVNPVGTTINQYFAFLDPIIVDPGYSWMVIPWAASIAGAMSWEFELIWAER